MKKVIGLFLALAMITSFGTNLLFAGDPDNVTNKFEIKTIKKDRLLKDYELKKEEFEVRTGKKLIDVYIDFQLGVGSTNATIGNARGTGTYNTESKVGVKTGGVISIAIRDLFSFTTGIELNGKQFSFTPPVTDPLADSVFTGAQNILSGTYMNIPLYINVGGMISEDVGLTFYGGPYLGFRVNTTTLAETGFKDFDLGISGTLTGSYVVAYPLSLLLGVNFQFGGLNNLGGSKFIDNITTQNFTVFSGARIGF